MDEYLKENGKMISGMEEAMRDIRMEMYIKANFNLEKLMEWDNTHGYSLEKFTTVNG
jgi:hypothetical protein